MPLFDKIRDYKNNIALVSSKYGNIKYRNIIENEYKLKKIINKRSLILIISTNSIAPIITYIFSTRNNCVVMLIDNKTEKENVENIINKYQHDFIVLPEEWHKNSKLNKNKKLLTFYDYALIKNNNQNIEQDKINEDISLLLATSGSLGSPKFVILSKENLETNTNSIIKFLKILEKDRAITTMPLSYTYMLSIVNTHIEKGASILITDNSLMSRDFWNEYNSSQITTFSGVPYIFEMLTKLKIEKIYTPFLKTITQAGGRLDKKIILSINNFCEKRDINFIVMYGQTEATARISYLDYKFLKNKIGSIGKSISGGKIWLEDLKGNKIEKSGISGELIYQGPNVFMGYARDRYDLSIYYKKNYKLRTGDIASFDEEGFYYIEGRIKRIAKIFGNRFNLDEIEEKMKEKGFKIVCVNSNKKLLICYDQPYLEKEISMHLSKITHQNKSAFECVKIESIPRTSSGKIDYDKVNKIQL